MDLSPGTFVFFLAVFSIVGVVFLFIHLLMGKAIRPSVPDKEKLTIYECGEPTVGSAWVQFDLRYYVVALLFVIFDVEVAFFFPWATVFGTANEIAAIDEQKVVVKQGEQLTQAQKDHNKGLEEQRAKLSEKLMPSGLSNERKVGLRLTDLDGTAKPISSDAARTWAQIGIGDMALFFAILMVGFAYVWRRGDINWVRSYAHHAEPALPPEKPLEQETIAAAPVPKPPPVAVH